MRISKLKLSNFRNYQNLDLTFDPQKNVFLIIGKNAQGKTNIVEAVYLLALSKSFRTSESAALVARGADFFDIQADIVLQEEETNLQIIHQISPKKKKAQKINGVKKNVTDFVGNFFVTLFSPDDINLVFLAPALRRKYLDVVLSQMNSDYLKSLLKLKKVLQNRNRILKMINQRKSQPEELLFWNEKLAEIGIFIVKTRRKMIDFYNQQLTNYYQKISQAEHQMEIRYKSNMRGLNKSEILENLQARLERDLREESTIMGPQRDDLVFILDEQLMPEFCSRGEIRSGILALKMTEIDFFYEQTKSRPVLLLDDAFSELDEDRMSFLLETLKSHQTIITTTHDHEQTWPELARKEVFYCENGQIKNV